MKYFKDTVRYLKRCEFSPFQYLIFYGLSIVFFGLIYSFFGKQLIKGYGWFWDGFYFSVITATTVGYGDMSPVGIGKLFTSFQSVVSIAIFAFAMSAFSERKAEEKFRLQNLMALKEKRKSLKNLIYCMRGWGEVFETAAPKGDGFKSGDLTTQLQFIEGIVEYLDQCGDAGGFIEKYVKGIEKFSRDNVDNLRIQRVRADVLGLNPRIQWEKIIHLCERVNETADEDPSTHKQNINGWATQVTLSLKLLVKELAALEDEIVSLESV